MAVDIDVLYHLVIPLHVFHGEFASVMVEVYAARSLAAPPWKSMDIPSANVMPTAELCLGWD